MIPSDDWRRQGQERYLRGVTLVHRTYRQNPTNPAWDHDHCEFCGLKFKLEEEAGKTMDGYATEDDYRWICPACYDDFKNEFGWILRESNIEEPNISSRDNLP